eukprot:IDg16026t1
MRYAQVVGAPHCAAGLAWEGVGAAAVGYIENWSRKLGVNRRTHGMLRDVGRDGANRRNVFRIAAIRARLECMKNVGLLCSPSLGSRRGRSLP